MQPFSEAVQGGPAPGSRIQAVRAAGPHEVLLETHLAGRGLQRWVLSAHPQAARFVEVFGAPLHDVRPQPFVLALRSWLVGGHVAGVTLRQANVIDVEVGTADGAYRLLLEMQGPASDLLVLQPGEHVRLRLHGASTRDPGAAPSAGQPLYKPPALWRDPGNTPSRLPAADPAAALQLDTDWRTFLAQLALREAKLQAQRSTQAQLKKLGRRLANLQEEEAACADAEHWRQWGELLKIHLDQVRKGQTELPVSNVFLPGAPVEVVALDPHLGPAENMARMFHKYRKARDGLPHVRRRIRETLIEQARWSEAQGLVEQATDAAEVERALAGLGPSAAGKPARSPAAKAHPAKGAAALQRMSADGLPILVGRSAQENDSLTFQVGRGRDWWFHAVGVAGSHVLVRQPRDAPLPPATLREAAWLAAYYSKGRNLGQLEVTYTQRKHVRRLKGGKPGQVTLGQAKTIWIDLADADARRVLDRMPPAA